MEMTTTAEKIMLRGLENKSCGRRGAVTGEVVGTALSDRWAFKGFQTPGIFSVGPYFFRSVGYGARGRRHLGFGCSELFWTRG